MFLHIEKIPENVRLFIEGAWNAITMFLNLFLLIFSGVIFYSDKKVGVFSLILTIIAIVIPILSSAVWEDIILPYIHIFEDIILHIDIFENIECATWLLIIAIVNAVVALLTPSGMPSENLEIIHRIAQALSLISCAMLRCKLFFIYRILDEPPEFRDEIYANVISLVFILSFTTLLVIHFGNGMFVI